MERGPTDLIVGSRVFRAGGYRIGIICLSYKFAPPLWARRSSIGRIFGWFFGQCFTSTKPRFDGGKNRCLSRV